MTIVLILGAVLAGWVLVAVVLALVMGRAIGIADKQHARLMATKPSASRASVSSRPRPVLAGARRF